jgi:hypothetical protein
MIKSRSRQASVRRASVHSRQSVQSRQSRQASVRRASIHASMNRASVSKRHREPSVTMQYRGVNLLGLSKTESRHGGGGTSLVLSSATKEREDRSYDDNDGTYHCHRHS